MTAPAIDTSKWLSLGQCADLAARSRGLRRLADLAATDPDHLGDDEITVYLAHWAHHSLTAEQTSLAFDDHMALLRMLTRLDTGEIGWQDVDADLTCDNRTEVAREICDLLAEDALNELIHGVGRGVR